MKQHQGVWLPDHERHLVEWMNRSGELVEGRGTYQIKKLRAALDHVRNWRTAVDVGAHVGFWSMHLVRKFNMLHAFEPVEGHRECWGANLPDAVKYPMTIRLHPFALGAEPGAVAMTIPEGSSGGTHVSGPGGIERRTLDSFGLQDVDFIKIDCEGYELEVLQGAAETLDRCRPCIIVEQKKHIMEKNFGTKGRPALDFLAARGARVRQRLFGDYILNWDPA